MYNGTAEVGSPQSAYALTQPSTSLMGRATVNSYTLTVNPNGGSWNNTTNNSTFTLNYGATKTIANPTKSSAGAGNYTVTLDGNGASNPTALTASRTTSYSFTSWSVAGAGASISGTTFKMGTANATLTANYNSSKSTSAVTLPNITRNGYTFNGWYTASSGGTKVGGANSSYTPSSDTTLYAQWTANDLKITKAELDKGKFENVTPVYLTNQVDGSDGFTITGTAKDNNVWSDSCQYCNMETYLRWDYVLDFTNYSKLTFYAKQNSINGAIRVIITDGLHQYENTSAYGDGVWIQWTVAPQSWTKYEIDLRSVTGKHTISFVGGYIDVTGREDSSTSYCNVIFHR